MEEVTFYMIMQVNRWENMTLSTGAIEVEFIPWLGVGFCRVFDTYEEAQKHADGNAVVCVQRKKQVEKE